MRTEHHWGRLNLSCARNPILEEQFVKANRPRLKSLNPHDSYDSLDNSYASQDILMWFFGSFMSSSRGSFSTFS